MRNTLLLVEFGQNTRVLPKQGLDLFVILMAMLGNFEVGVRNIFERRTVKHHFWVRMARLDENLLLGFTY